MEVPTLPLGSDYQTPSSGSVAVIGQQGLETSSGWHQCSPKAFAERKQTGSSPESKGRAEKWALWRTTQVPGSWQGCGTSCLSCLSSDNPTLTALGFWNVSPLRMQILRMEILIGLSWTPAYLCGHGTGLGFKPQEPTEWRKGWSPEEGEQSRQKKKKHKACLPSWGSVTSSEKWK